MAVISRDRWFLLLWLPLTMWLLACALLIQGEYGDGYQTIVNARYLFGDSPNYFVQRGPLAAISLWPVEFVANLAAVDAVDVRPYHLYSAALHSAYLIACWLLLQRAPGTVTARLIALAAAILSVVFYAYAPFLSHDILPGLLFLILIFLAHRWIETRQTRDAIYLVALGAAVTLIKQTYALFWVAIVIFAVLACLLKWDSARVSIRALLQLIALAATSAIICWLSYAWFIGGELPDESWLTRPLHLVTAITGQYGDAQAGMFATDLYLRNLPNYGIATVLLVIPGALLAIRGNDSRMRMIAVCWIVCACSIQFIGFREARYLGFLAPLSAMLIVPVIDRLRRQRLAFAVLLLVVIVDQTRGIRTALTPLTTAASVDVLRFVNSVGEKERVVASRVLSFAYAASSPFSRDRYHGIFHLTPELLTGLYEGQVEAVSFADPRTLGQVGIVAGDRVYFGNNTLVRRPPWTENNRPAGMDSFLLVAGRAAEVSLRRRDDAFHRSDADGSYVMYLPAVETIGQMPVISANPLSLQAAANLYGSLADAATIDVVVVHVTALCQVDSCSYR